MSNTTTNAVEVPETEAPVDVQPTENKESKNVAFRVFGALFAILAIVSLFLPFAYVLKDGVATKTSLFFSIVDLFKGKSVSKLFGFLPTYANVTLDTGAVSMPGVVTAMVYYVFFLMIVISVILGIITIFTKKKAPGMLRATVFFFLSAYSMYLLWNVCNVLVDYKKFLLDIVCLSATAIGLIAYLVLAINRVGKKAWASFLQFILSLAASCILIFAFEADTDTFSTGLSKLGIKQYQIIILVVVALCALNILSAYIRIQLKKGLPFDCIRYSLQAIVAGFASYMELAFNKEGKLFVILAIVATGVSILQIIISIIQVAVAKKAKKKQADEETPVEEGEAEAIVQEYVTEEHAEAVPYEGGPVEGVEMAELVEENPEQEEATEETAETTPVQETQTAGYDFYNTKSFDPFIATLNDTERNEFTDIFVLRCKGDMPEIPTYVVGQPSKDFFRKIFVYLGKYRDMLPDGLLSKIYQFSLKLK